MKRSGVADLPLHGGRVPQWLADRMSKLGTGIVEAIVERYGRSELPTVAAVYDRRLSIRVLSAMLIRRA